MESVVGPLDVIIKFNGEVVIVAGNVLPDGGLLILTCTGVVCTVIVDNETVGDDSRISCVHREREDCRDSQQREHDYGEGSYPPLKSMTLSKG